jgi:hypothetical protein
VVREESVSEEREKGEGGREREKLPDRLTAGNPGKS